MLEIERDLGRSATGPRFGPRDDRPRPAPLRRRTDRRAGPRGAAPTPPRAPLRARAADGSRSRPSSSPGTGPWRPWSQGYNQHDVAPRRARRVRGGARAPAEEGILGRLPAVPLLRPDARIRPISATSRAPAASPAEPTRSSKSRWRTSGSGTRTGRADHPAGRVFTSGDVTVEELRGDGEEPSLTAEALAERIGETLGPDDDVLSTSPADAPRGRRRQHPDCLRPLRGRSARRALADRDRGPSHRRRARRCWSAASSISRAWGGSASLRPCPSSFGSTRPSPSGTRRRRCSCSSRACARGFRFATTTRARSAPTGSRTPSRRRTGTARRASSSTSAPRPTSTSSPPPGEYVGGVLAPGIEVSMEALFARAARLIKVDFVEPPAVIGTSTASALQSGLVYGFAGQVDGIVERIRGELGVEARAVATGGPCGTDRPAFEDDRAGRSLADPGRAPPRLGSERLGRLACVRCEPAARSVNFGRSGTR